MYKRLLIFTFCVIGLITVLGFLPIRGESELYQNVVRLHVLANSDSEEDQTLKLEVRDAILEKTQLMLRGCTSKSQAQQIIEYNLPKIEATAKNAVTRAGYDYSVSVQLGNEEYPTKNYEGCCFPAGEYLSLRVLIGSAEGQNWWCVLFPPMCLSAASDSSEAFAQVGLTGDQYNVITQTQNPKYKVRFKLLEAFETALKN